MNQSNYIHDHLHGAGKKLKSLVHEPLGDRKPLFVFKSLP